MSILKVGVFDVDGTTYRDSLSIDLIDRLRAMGALSGEPFLESDRLRKLWKSREVENSYEAYSEALVYALEEQRAFTCRAEVAHQVCTQLIEEKGRQVYEFTRELILTLRDLDYTLIAISGSPKAIVDDFVRQFGFDHVRATEYEVVDGWYTGKIHSLPVKNKAMALNKVLHELGTSLLSVVAVGDTSSDFGMLSHARYPIAFNPSRNLKRQIRDGDTGMWHRPIGVVTQRKDDINVSRFVNDGSLESFLQECPLRDLLPADVAEALKYRLGILYGYDG